MGIEKMGRGERHGSVGLWKGVCGLEKITYGEGERMNCMGKRGMDRRVKLECPLL